MSAFNCYIHRLLYLPLDESAIKKELNILKQLAISNGYNIDIIDKIYKKKLLKKRISEAYNTTSNSLMINQNVKYFSLPFIGDINYKIKNIVDRHNFQYHISFEPLTNLKKEFCRKIDKIDNLEKSGVYKLQCDCGKAYIGQTGRTFKKRFQEHINCIKVNNNNLFSSFAEHILQTSHSFNPNNFKILHIKTKGSDLNFLEQLEIIKLEIEETSLNEKCKKTLPPLLNILIADRTNEL